MKKLALYASLVIAGCGGKTGTIEIDVVTSGQSNPLQNAALIQFTVGTKVQSATVTNGSYSIEIDQKPPNGDPLPIVVEAFDASNTLLGYGQTPGLSLDAVDQGPYSVWLGTVGAVSPADTGFMTPRTDLTGVASAGLGGVFSGGRDATGAALATAEVYDVFTQSILQVANMASPRAGAVGVASSPNAIVFGGSTSTATTPYSAPVSTAELFDPSSGTGLWSAIPASTTPVATSYPSLTLLGSGSALITGGASANGMPNNGASLVSTVGTIEVTPIPTGMTAPRLHHATAAATFSDGAGALIIGGLAAGDTHAIVERFVNNTFDATNINATGVENRWDATATAITGGVLLVGGTVPDMMGTRVATKSIIFIPTQGANTMPMRYDTLMPHPRARHTATLIGTDLLICGGYDDTNAPVLGCDLIGTSPLAYKKSIATGAGRMGHAAGLLETGVVLLAGGTSSIGGAPLTTIDIYTPEAVDLPHVTAAGVTSTTSN